MRYFTDTEFIDDGKTIDLISIGIVCEDGREYYAQVADSNPAKASPWVKEHVFPHLVACTSCDSRALHSLFGACPWRTSWQIRDEIRGFLTDPTELWGWCAGYDFVALCQLFGTMMDLPAGWPHYIRDLQYILDEAGVSDGMLPPQQGTAHNALEDARYIKDLWAYSCVPKWRYKGPVEIGGNLKDSIIITGDNSVVTHNQ
jgi:hypothetical protein